MGWFGPKKRLGQVRCRLLNQVASALSRQKRVKDVNGSRMGCDTAGRTRHEQRGAVGFADMVSLWRHDRRCWLRLQLLGRWIPRSSTQISREQQGASGSGLVAEKGSCWQRCRRKISESIVIYFGGGSQRQRPYSTVGLRPVLLSVM